MGGRTGFEVTFARTFFVVLVLVIGFMVTSCLTGACADALVSGISNVYKKSDATRVQSAVSQLRGAGTGAINLTLDQSYQRIEVSGTEVTLDPAESDPITASLPARFSYAGASLAGKHVCVVKSGLSYRFDAGQCVQPRCSTGTCDAVTVERAGETVPRWGYTCQGEMFTREAFFRRYYREGCGSVSSGEPFAHINRARCSRQTDTCLVVATWRCGSDSGTATATFSGVVSGTAFDRSCTGDIQHARGTVGGNLPVAGSRPDATIQTPGEQMTTTAAVDEVSRWTAQG